MMVNGFMGSYFTILHLADELVPKSYTFVYSLTCCLPMVICQLSIYYALVTDTFYLYSLHCTKCACSFCLCACAHLSVSLSVCLSVCLSACIPAYLPPNTPVLSKLQFPWYYSIITLFFSTGQLTTISRGVHTILNTAKGQEVAYYLQY